MFDPRKIIADYNRQKIQFIWRPGPRYFNLNRGEGFEPRRVAECDPVTWKTPGGQSMVTYAIVPCPQCGFQMPVKIGQQADFDKETGLLTVRGVLKCPGHWQQTDERGHGRGTARCGWQGVIREGSAHNPRCPHADYSRHFTDNDWQSCVCGGVLSPDEKEMEARSIARQSRGQS